MTVSNQTNRTSATGTNTIGQAVAFTFPVGATSDLVVLQRVTATGVETTLTETTNYTVSILADAGGTVTMVTAVAVTAEIHVYRDTPSTQSLDLVTGGTFNAENLETALDKNTKLIIETEDARTRTLRFSQTDPAASLAEMPNAIDRASSWLYFGTDGAPTTASSVTPSTSTVSTFMDTVLDDATAGAAMATLQGMPVFNVTNTAYGADPTGATDSAAAIQLAIDAAQGAGGGIVFVPSGTYIVEADLTLAGYSNVHIRGSGMNNTSIKVNTTNVIAFTITGVTVRCSIEDMWIGGFSAQAGTGAISVIGTDGSNVSAELQFRNLKIQNVLTPIYCKWMHQSWFDRINIVSSIASAVTGVGIHCVEVVSTSFRNITFLAVTHVFGADNIRIDQDCDTVIMENVNISGGTTGYGIRCLNTAGTTGPRLSRFVNCLVETCSLQGFQVSAGREIKFIGCLAAVNGVDGYYVTGGDCIEFTNCLALQNDNHGFFINGGDGVILTGCTASNNSQDTDNTYDGIRIENNQDHVIVTGCRSGDYIFALANDQRYGLSVGTGCDYIVVNGCDLEGNQTGDLTVASTQTTNNIRHSPGIVTLADEGTPNINGGELFLTGGTTTITDFDAGWPGKKITVIAEHSLDITDGTEIFLSGSATWSMTATDTLTLVQKADGKWYETARSDSGA